MFKQYLVLALSLTAIISNCTEQQEKKQKNNGIIVLHDTIKAISASGMEVISGRPCDNIKTTIVTGQPISFNLANLYRGIGTHCWGIIPNTIVQMQMTTLFERLGLKNTAAPTAGFFSTVIACPIDHLILKQIIAPKETKFESLPREIKKFIQQHGVRQLYKGAPMVGLRELIFTSGYMKIMPWLQEKSKKISHNFIIQNLFAASIGGTSLSLASHWTETIRMWQQTNKGSTCIDVIKKMQETSPGFFKTAFKGALPRSIRYSLALLVMAETKKKTESFLNKIS